VSQRDVCVCGWKLLLGPRAPRARWQRGPQSTAGDPAPARVRHREGSSAAGELLLAQDPRERLRGDQLTAPQHPARKTRWRWIAAGAGAAPAAPQPPQRCTSTPQDSLGAAGGSRTGVEPTRQGASLLSYVTGVLRGFVHRRQQRSVLRLPRVLSPLSRPWGAELRPSPAGQTPNPWAKIQTKSKGD